MNQDDMGEDAPIRYATGEVAQVGDHVNADGWKSVVEDVIDTAERSAYWGLCERGLMMRCAEAGLFFHPVGTIDWDAIVLLRRGGA